IKLLLIIMFEDFFDFDIEELEKRFKEALRQGTNFFASEEEFESLIDFYYFQGKYSYTEKAIEKAMILYPMSSILWYKKGYFLYYTKKYHEALSSFKNAYLFDKTDLQNTLYIALTYIELNNIRQAQKFFDITIDLLNIDNNDYYDILFLCNDIIYSNIIDQEENPFTIDDKLNHKKRLKLDLIEALLKNITIENDEIAHAQKLENLALCSSLKGHLKKSINYLNEAIQLDPFNYDRWIYLALLYYRTKNYNKSLECLEYSLAIFPENPEALHIKGSTHFQLKEYHKALETYQELINYDFSDESEIYLNIGKCYECLNDPLNATAYYLKSYESDNNNIKALINLGALFLELHDLDMSYHYLHMAMKINKEDAELNYTLADLMLQKNELNKAIHYINKALEYLPHETDFILLQSEIFQAKGNLKKSINVLKNSIDFVEDKVRFYYRIAGLYILLNQKNMAYHYLKTAISENPNLVSNFLESFPETKNDNLFKGLLNLPQN
ncbi:MAG: tetratricopeptide repeat protein, partial [Bacteroidales bacterium]